MEFNQAVYGKWILAGEHTVLRGGSCLVFPLLSRSVRLHYVEQSPPVGLFRPSSSALSVEFFGTHGDEYRLLFWGVLERACEILKVGRHSLKGALEFHGHLPIGAGLGASAALCVSVVTWLRHLGFVRPDQEFALAKKLEDVFHGESSGVDVAAALAAAPLEFKANQEPVRFQINWRPKLYVSYSGKRGVTKECVEKVQRLAASDPGLFEKIDTLMTSAVTRCQTALQQPAGPESLSLLADGIESAAECFRLWLLTEGGLSDHLQQLKAEGAIAVKPTGSGGGGYALSLWDQEPPVHLKNQLLSCFGA